MSHFDLDAVRGWFERVYSGAPGLLSVVHVDATGKFNGTGGSLPDIDAAVRRVAALDRAGSRGIYARVTTLARPLDRHERGTEADSLALPGLWADVDFGEVGHKAGRGLPLPPTAEDAWRIVSTSGLPQPSLWVHSGGGLYPWWLLEAPVVLDETTRPHAADLSAQWQQALKRSAGRLGYEYGAGVGDLPRVLRIPGTVNRKDGRERACRVMQDDGTAYTIEDLTKALTAVTPEPEPTRQAAPQQPRERVELLPNTGMSAFDILDQHVTFDDILTGAGWARHNASHPPSVDQCWSRPDGPDNPCSAHTLKANPHVLVVHSELAGLPTGGGQKLTRGRVFAHLWHGGDERAAALDLFAAISGRPSTKAAAALPLPRDRKPVTSPANNVVRDIVDFETRAQRIEQERGERQGQTHEPGSAPPPVFDLERDDFWTARPELGHLRDFARARRASPWAVLGCALVRVIAHVEPFVVLPPTIGGYASLNLFLGLVGPSGGGKGAAESAAKDAMQYAPPLQLLTEVGVGSGEGIAHTYSRYVPGKKGEKGHVEQHQTRALFRAPEVDTLAALKGRQGSTLLPKLRDAWIGDALGFAYADVTRRIDLAAHSYRLCLIVGIQPARASVLLDDADGGTPQRFLWMPTLDAAMPERKPAAPDRLRWRHPSLGVVAPEGRHVLDVCDTATQAIDQAAIDRNRGQVDALDGHSLLSRLKTAAALGLLNGHASVTDEDWALAGTVMAISDATRAGVVRQLGDRFQAAAVARGRADGIRDSVADEVRADETAKRVGKAILRKLGSEWATRNEIRKTLASRDREHFDDAIERLQVAGLVESEDLEYRGSDGARYRRAKGVAA